MPANSLHNPLIKTLKDASNRLGAEKKSLLDRLNVLVEEHSISDLVFICTHNSRRSQAAELLLHLLAKHFELNLNSYSCGTEETAFHDNMVQAFKALGVDLVKYGTGNPLYVYQPEEDSKYFYSKSLDQLRGAINYLAITVCSDAEENCPYFPNAKVRFHLGFEDPKSADGTPAASQVYQEKIIEIGAQLYYLTEKLNT